MKDLRVDAIMAGTRNAQRNTWGGRYNLAIPNIVKEGEVITYSTTNARWSFSDFDEITLWITMKFLFCPVWLIRKWYSSGLSMAGNEDYVDNMIKEWEALGIVWSEYDVTGRYIRPTYALFQMFGQDPYHYVNIPFNMLRHTICEEQVCFDIMSGNSEIVKNEVVMPRISELGFEGKLTGTNVLNEEDFRNPWLGNDAYYGKIVDIEARIDQGMKNGDNLTPELEDFRNFYIVKKVGNTGSIKNDLKFHIPDLAIPVIRDAGRPQSIAIEVELSDKRATYEETMLRYRDNNKYGVVYWLCSTSSVANHLREAYDAVGGTGSCRMELLEFVMPAPNW